MTRAAADQRQLALPVDDGDKGDGDDAGPPGDGASGALRKGRRKAKSRGLRIRVSADGGWDVRHASDAAGRAPGDHGVRAVELGDAAHSTDPKVWIQVAKVGQWAGHPAGPFQLGAREFAEMVRNFRATQNRRIPIDFEHASEQDAASGSIPVIGAPAQGWILDLDDRGADGLWGLVEWGDLARGYIREKKYLYLSPAVRFDSRDRVSGARIGTRLTSAALTNQPFLDGMAQLVARDLMGAGIHAPSEYLPQVRCALRASALAPAAELQDQLTRLRALAERATTEAPVVDGVDVRAVVCDLAAAVGARVGTSVGELLDSVAQLIDDATDDGAEGPDAYAAPMVGATDGDEDDDADGSTGLSSGGGEGTTTMTTDEQKKLSDAEAACRTAETRANKAELQLSEAQARVAKLEVENKALADAGEKREAADREREVDEILASDFADPKAKSFKGLDPAKRPQLLKLLSDSPEAFRSLYPVAELRAARSTPAGRHPHLFADVATGPNAVTRDHAPQGGFDAPGPVVRKAPKTLAQLTDKYVRRGMPLDEAVVKAGEKMRACAQKGGR